MSKIENATVWMENTANDNSHGYDQRYRWGEKGDFDCSSAVFEAWEKSGVPIKTYALKNDGIAYTGNMRKACLANGFKDVTKEVNLKTGYGLRRGDILLHDEKHVAMYCGNMEEVEASINEKGGAIGGVPGDQTGKEFLIRPYRNFPWKHVLRYVGDMKAGVYMFNVEEISKGSKNNSVTLLQTLLRGLVYMGYDGMPLIIDGDFGTNTLYAVECYQQYNHLTVDGIVGVNTWNSLIKL